MDTIINVTPTEEFVFNPDKLLIRVISTDIVNKTAQIYYELTESNIGITGRTNREWVDRGNAQLPLDVVAGAYNADGTPNQQVIDAVLANFKLQLAAETATF